MGRGLLLLLASLAVPSAALAQRQPTTPAKPTFKSGVDLVTVTATVRDRKGRLVKGLEAADFEVLDRGEARRITEFRADASPVSLAILFDISGSMRVADRMLAAKFAAHHLLSWLEPGRDEAALFTFDSRLHEVAPFTVDTRTLQGALGEVDPFGATSLHDAIAGAAHKAAQRTGRRRAVVVITDGVDNGSGLTPGEVSGIASAIDVPVYILATVLPIDHLGREGALPRPATEGDDSTIENLATWTGGTFFFVSTPSDTSNASRQVLDELRTQYVIAFESAPSEGWRPLEIRMRNKDLVVRARSGYMAGGARGVF
jgi:Ca-activated chloride channel family protein